jgi:hypothetical protein
MQHSPPFPTGTLLFRHFNCFVVSRVMAVLKMLNRWQTYQFVLKRYPQYQIIHKIYFFTRKLMRKLVSSRIASHPSFAFLLTNSELENAVTRTHMP